MTALFTALYALLGTFAGFALLSLSIQRHYKLVWPQRASRPQAALKDKTLLRLAGAACLALTFAATLAESTQLGVLHWAGYLMIAGLLVTGLHSYATSMVRAASFGAATLFASLTAAAMTFLR